MSSRLFAAAAAAATAAALLLPAVATAQHAPEPPGDDHAVADAGFQVIGEAERERFGVSTVMLGIGCRAGSASDAMFQSQEFSLERGEVRMKTRLAEFPARSLAFLALGARDPNPLRESGCGIARTDAVAVIPLGTTGVTGELARPASVRFPFAAIQPGAAVHTQAFAVDRHGQVRSANGLQHGFAAIVDRMARSAFIDIPSSNGGCEKHRVIGVSRLERTRRYYNREYAKVTANAYYTGYAPRWIPIGSVRLKLWNKRSPTKWRYLGSGYTTHRGRATIHVPSYRYRFRAGRLYRIYVWLHKQRRYCDLLRTNVLRAL